MHNKQKKAIKDQSKFPLNAFFKVFVNSVSVHSKIYAPASLTNKMINFSLFSQFAIFSKLKNILHFTATMKCIPNIKFSFLSQSQKCQSVVIINHINYFGKINLATFVIKKKKTLNHGTWILTISIHKMKNCQPLKWQSLLFLK